MSWLTRLLHPRPGNWTKRALTCKVDEIPAGSLILTYTIGNLISEAIANATHKTVSHALIVVGPHGLTAEAEATGMEFKTLFSRIADPDVQMWVWVPVPMDPERMARVAAYARGTVGKPYDFSRVIGFLISHHAHPSQAQLGMEFCSEDASASEQDAGYVVSDRKPFDTTPADIDRYLRSHPEAWRLFALQNAVS